MGAWIHRDLVLNSRLCTVGAVDTISQNTDVYTVIAHKDSRKSSQVLLWGEGRDRWDTEDAGVLR